MRAVRILMCIALVGLPTLQARAVEPHQEYAERIKITQNIAAISAVDGFGETVNPFNGSTEFNYTDIDIPGNNQLGRRVGNSARPAKEGTQQ